MLAALWRSGPLSAPRLIAAVRERQAWADGTIKTLLARLMHKGLVQSVRDDGRQVYRPLLDRDAFAEAEVLDLVRRLYDGDASRLLARLNARREGS